MQSDRNLAICLISDLASRKILEEIQMKKQILLKQGAATALNSSNIASALPVGGNNVSTISVTHHYST